MSDYKTIHGVNVRDYTADPDNPIIGQVWYDKTAAALQFQFPTVTTAGAWRTGGIMNTGRVELAGAGTQTAGLMFGGTPNTGKTESYNGAIFSEVADLNTARNGLGGAGASNTSALAFGGGAPADNSVADVTELYNGTNWTELNDMNTARHFSGDAGNATAALVVSGDTGSLSVNVESWNGTNWTEIANVNVARELGASNGTTTSSLFYGGTPGSGSVANNESWNGTSWTEVADLNAGRYNWKGIGASNTDALAASGYTGTANSALVELWNGSTWAETTNVSDDGNGFASSGSTALGLIAGGNGRANNNVSEEWTGAGATVFAWSTGGSMNTARNLNSRAGIYTSALTFGGGNSAHTEKYNGTAWTELNNLNLARNSISGFGASGDSAIAAGGYASEAKAETELWNGTNWTEVNNLNRATSAATGIGIATSGLAAGRADPSVTAQTETWNGTNWTNVNDMNTSRSGGGGAGPNNTDGLVYGGYTVTSNTELWNGTNWSEVNNMNTGRASLSSAGNSSTAALGFGGGSSVAITEDWNGASWSEVGDLNTGRTQGNGTGTSTNALAFGGEIPPNTGATEEWDSGISTKTVDTD